MSSRSLVNKSVVKSDLRRYWALGALFFMLLILTAVLPVKRFAEFNELIDRRDFFRVMGGSILSVMLFGIITPAILFSYLHKSASVSAMHSLPIRREGLYASHLVSSAILTLAPVIVSAVIMLGIKDINPAWVFAWLWCMLVYLVLLTGIGALSAILTGNVFASIVLPYIVIMLPFYIEAVAISLCDNFLAGFDGPGYGFISRFLYADFDSLMSGMAWLYLALGAVFLAAGLICYRKRALENNSRLIAFKVLDPVFLYGFAICAGFLGGEYISIIFGRGLSLWFVLPFGIIGVIAARMIIARSVRPGKLLRPILIYIAAVAAVFAVMQFDLIGFEKRIPKAEDVEYAYLSDRSGYSAIAYMQDGRPLYLASKAVYNPKVTDKADIEKIIALHKAVAGKDDDIYSEYYQNTIVIPIEYRLKNGRTLKRRYHIVLNDEIRKLYDEAQNIMPIRAERFPVIDTAEKEYTAAHIECCGRVTENLTVEQINEIVEALKADITAAGISELDGDTVTSVVLTARKPTVTQGGTAIEDKSKWASEDYYYNIRPGYKNSIALLSEWGLYDNMPSAEDIERVEISKAGIGQNSETVSDKDGIQRLIDQVYASRDKLSASTVTGGYSVTFCYTDDRSWTTIVPYLPER